MKRYTLIVHVLMLCTLCGMAQKSYIVQIQRGQSLISSLSSNNRSATRHTIRQLCDEPMNLWEVNGEYISRRSIVDDFGKYATIVLVKENRTFSLRKAPNDSLYSKQWQYKNNGVNSQGGKIGADINAEEAWTITTGGNTVNGDAIVVAVVDDGFDTDHEDIVDNLWVNKFEVANDGIDNDNNGYIDDVNGWNVGEGNGNVNTGSSHGTSVMGIVGAKGNNKKGVTGVNWDIKLMPIDYGIATEANAIASYAYAYKMRKLYNESNGVNGAFVVATNSSWGIDRGKPEDAPLWCAFYDSLGTIGILSLAATANLNVDVDLEGDLPTACKSEYLVAVTNITKTDIKETGAGYGKKSIDIGAFGSSIFTISNNNRYTSFGGTSGATPHVAGAVALMYSVQCQEFGNLIKSSPSKAALFIKDILLSTTSVNPSIEAFTTTGGKLDLGKAVSTMHNQCNSCKYPAGIVVDAKTDMAVVSWQSTGATVSLRIRKEGEANWRLFENIANDIIAIDSIEICTGYEFQLKYTCNGNESEWAYRKYFTTEGCCEAPQAIGYTINNNALFLTNNQGQPFILEYKAKTSNVWDSIIYSKDTIIHELIACNNYNIRLTTYCAIQNKFTPASDIEVFTTPCGNCTEKNYCKPKSLSNNFEWIDSVYIGDTFLYSGSDADGYGNHMGTILPKALQGDSFYIKIVPGYRTNNYFENFTTFIDWNQSQSFEANELVFKSDTVSRTAVSGFVKVPVDATPGYTRLRTIMSFNHESPACEGPAQFGEAEDYCFLVEKKVGLSEVRQDALQLFPNPNDGTFRFTCKTDERIEAYIIVNALGQLIDSYDGIACQCNEINYSQQLHSGLYSIIVKTGKTAYTKNFIVR